MLPHIEQRATVVERHWRDDGEACGPAARSSRSARTRRFVGRNGFAPATARAYGGRELMTGGLGAGGRGNLAEVFTTISQVARVSSSQTWVARRRGHCPNRPNPNIEISDDGAIGAGGGR